MKARKLTFIIAGLSGLACTSMAQVPDLLNALDAGGRAMGAGGSLYATGSDTLSSYYNPAGLGYASQGAVGVAYRNLPKSKTKASDEFGDLRLDSSGERGNNAISHVGLNFPLQEGRHGVIGVSYTIGGYINDERSNAGVLVGGNPVNFYSERLKAQSDYFSVGYGKASASQDFSWGIGLQYVRQKISDRALLVDSGNNTLLNTDLDETGNGLGIIAGLQFIPKSNPNVSFGLSYRSEINLTNNNDTKSLYDKIPARLLAGVAFRQDGMRGGRDFIVYGLQIMHFFEGESSQVFDRKAQTTVGFGLEYNYQTNGFRIPIRLGYNVVPSGGDDFGSRNAFTFGLGYRPLDNRFGVDFNFASPESGGFDLGISLNYRFGK
jgi:hypothetical protein